MKTGSITETEQLLKAITNRQTELESLTSHMISNAQNSTSCISSTPSVDQEKIKEWLNLLENISSLSSSISKTI